MFINGLSQSSVLETWECAVAEYGCKETCGWCSQESLLTVSAFEWETLVLNTESVLSPLSCFRGRLQNLFKYRIGERRRRSESKTKDTLEK